MHADEKKTSLKLLQYLELRLTNLTPRMLISKLSRSVWSTRFLCIKNHLSQRFLFNQNHFPTVTSVSHKQAIFNTLSRTMRQYEPSSGSSPPSLPLSLNQFHLTFGPMWTQNIHRSQKALTLRFLNGRRLRAVPGSRPDTNISNLFSDE